MVAVTENDKIAHHRGTRDEVHSHRAVSMKLAPAAATVPPSTTIFAALNAIC